jgi:hypothetical protein
MNFSIVFIFYNVYISSKLTEVSMKKFLLPIFFLLAAALSAGIIPLKTDGKTDYRIRANSSAGFEMELSVGSINYEIVKTEKGNFTALSFNNSGFSNEPGIPKIPLIRELIEFPEGSSPVIEVISVKEKEISLLELGISNRIVPAQPSYSKSSKPEERVFVLDEDAYKLSGYSKNESVKITKSGHLRGVDVGILEINPVAYDPSGNKISVITDIEFRVTYTGAKSDPSFSKAQHYSPYFESVFSKFINRIEPGSKNDLTRYPVTYLIAANEILSDNAKLQEFINWKTEKGFKVITQFFPSSATISTVDAWVESQYQNLTPKPSFLLIVGDQSGTYVVPTEQNPALGSQGSVTVSDLLYGVIGATASNNRIPSIHVGRFSVNTLADLDAQVDKTIWYEKTQFTSEADLSYLSKVMGVAGVDGNYATTHGNPQIKYGMSYYFNTSYRIPLDGSRSDITGIPYYYPESGNTSVGPAVVANVSSGVAFYNYTAHGSQTNFSDPTFTISNVDNLTNTGKYPLVIGNCCLTGSFGYAECFGEAWLNAPNKGGIGFIGASMSTYWDEDLAMGIGRADTGNTTPEYSPNDPGMYDALMMMDNPTQAGVRFAGLLAVERLGTSMTSSYWSSYHLFGDPSLMVYMGIPGENTVSHNPVLSPGDTFFTVQALKGSYVGITDDEGVLHGAAIADEFGYAVVPIDPPFETGNAHIAVTCQFKKPYFGSVLVEALTGPYLTVNSSSISSVLFASSGTVDLELKNIGVQTSEGITVSASSLSPYISFTDYQESFTSIAAGDSLKKTGAFSYTLSPNAPDRQEIRIDLNMNDTSKRTYYSSVTFKAESPVLSYSKVILGDINPGDSKEITFTVNNDGSAGLTNVTAALTALGSDPVTISSPQIISSLDTGATTDMVFTITFGSSIKNGTAVSFSLDLTTSAGFDNSYEFALNVGMTENFETGDFTANEWIFEGNAEWTADNAVYYSGQYSARSGVITHNQFTSLVISFEFLQDGTINFYRKTSSESGYDKLTFYIDGAAKGNWSGISDWTYQSYPVTAGVRTLTWTYNKDVSDTAGLDCAWVDNILATNILLSIQEDTAIIPEVPTLHQNYPNPFNPTTTIRFSVPSFQNVKLSIYNSNGQLVKNILDRKMDKGSYAVVMDASELISGVYFYALETQSGRLTQKMLLIK